MSKGILEYLFPFSNLYSVTKKETTTTIGKMYSNNRTPGPGVHGPLGARMLSKAITIKITTYNPIVFSVFFRCGCKAFIAMC